MTQYMEFPFLPTTPQELCERKWDALDVILVSGDSYVDSPFVGVAVVGRVLEVAGFKVGIIAQPDIHSDRDIKRLGEPRLFWGVSSGCVDSMIANHTAVGRPRRKDDFTPGGLNSRRPDRACIVYTNLIRRYFKSTRPIVLGGIEASLRRVVHYDYWSNTLRRSILFDAKADYLLYGMAENSVVAFARALKDKEEVKSIRGLCFISKEPPPGFIEIPSFKDVVQDKLAFIEMFHTFYHNQDSITAKGLIQKHGERYLVHNPPVQKLTQSELDAVYALPFQRSQHPVYEKQGPVKALETVRFSINSHRGCYGECNFCAIAVHEGRTVQWRSQASILAEAERITQLPEFKGYILDVGGPTANMYGFECSKKLKQGACEDRRCIYPTPCPVLKIDHQYQISLLRKLRDIPGVKKVFVGSGIRYDLVLSDQAHGKEYLEEITKHHVSGQLKVAPEHSENGVLGKMGKTGISALLKFKAQFDEISEKTHLDQYLAYYFIAAHPGCTEQDMRSLHQFTSRELHIHPEQVQIFTPSPSTYSSLMYYTELDPFSRQPVFVEKNELLKEKQKQIVTPKTKVSSAGIRTKQNFHRRNRRD
jgi:uncharacterized radical SAM protein YgiQ